MIKTIPKKKTCKKAKWLSEEALLIHEERREAKGKGEKERHTNLNVITHLEQDILECGQVGLGKHHYEKASGGDVILVELFQILKDDAVKVLH